MKKDLFYRVTVQAASAKYDLSADLDSLTLEEDNTAPDKVTVHVNDPYKVFGHAFQEGMDVELELGTDEDHSVMFRGRIYQVEGTFPETGVPTLTITAYDKSMAMGLQKRNRPWTGRTLSQIVAEVTVPYFPQQQIDVLGDPDFGTDGVRQQDETDLAFLLRLAAEYGCEMFVESNDTGETLNFLSQKSIMLREPAVTLYYGRCDAPARLLSFSPVSDVAKIQLPRMLSGIDYETGQTVDVTMGEDDLVSVTDDKFLDENLTAFRKRYPDKADQLEGLLGAAEQVQATLRTDLGTATREAVPTFITADQLQQMRDNQFSTSRLGMSASGTADGNKAIRAQSSIAFADVGGRFSNVWYLSQVKHVLSGQGYLVEFQCQR